MAIYVSVLSSTIAVGMPLEQDYNLPSSLTGMLMVQLVL
jgi:hypothetical protein